MQLAYRHGERPGESYEALDGKKVDVFISVFGMVSAELMQFITAIIFSGRFAAEWHIQI